MKRAIACGVLTILSGADAEARFRTKAVSAGQTTQVAVYTAWVPVSCESAFGIVKVVEKPKSGKLSNAPINTVIPISRFANRPGPCFGKPTKGFAVLYTPMKGFRGTDSFTLDISWPTVGKTETDTFSIVVQ